ncbi:MAG: nuclear transport factor 2 family protein, partial [Actinomycetota bacterium]
VTEHKPRFDASRQQRDDLADRFFAVMSGGDMADLVELLASDVTVYGDSGGIRPSWPRPISGRDHVVRLVAGLRSQILQLGVTMRRAEINGQPGALFYGQDGRLASVACLDITGGTIQTMRSVINPAKLGHLEPLSDFRDQLTSRQDRRPPA